MIPLQLSSTRLCWSQRVVTHGRSVGVCYTSRGRREDHQEQGKGSQWLDVLAVSHHCREAPTQRSTNATRGNKVLFGMTHCKTEVVRVYSNTSRPRRTRQLHEVTQGHPPWSHQDLLLHPCLRPEEELGLRFTVESARCVDSWQQSGCL